MPKPYQQDPPFAIQIEPTEGCNLMCNFCGLQGIRSHAGGPYKFMTLATANLIAQSIAAAGWTARIEAAMHGEPTLNKELVEIIAVFRTALPKNQLMVTSNGGGLLRGGSAVANIEALFSAGLNVLALDDYDGVKIVPRIREQVAAWHDERQHSKAAALLNYSGIETHEYPAELDYSPHHRWPVSRHMVIYVEDIAKATKGGHSVLNNHCGAGSPLNDTGMGKRCAKPFRELAFRWDGTVAGCCNDWRGTYKVGQLTKMSVKVAGKNVLALTELWNNAAFTAMRRKLYHGQRDFGPCKGCDAASYRVGLLPDKMGKVSLPKPTAEDLAAIKKALGGQMLTQIVLRPWEVK